MKVGFNAGNGTQSYEYLPYSQMPGLRDLASRGYVNGFPGRHIFRIDEKIIPGNCNKDIGKIFMRSLVKVHTFCFCFLFLSNKLLSWHAFTTDIRTGKW